jgi:hypothetical protein
MEAWIDGVNGMALSMVVVVVVVVDGDSFDKEVPAYLDQHQEEVDVHLNRSIQKF